MNSLILSYIFDSYLLIGYTLVYITIVILIILYSKNTSALYILKPLPVFSLICILLITKSYSSTASFLILAGLCAGLVGDIFMINPKKFFIFGLVSFFIGHILYSTAFLSGDIHFSIYITLLLSAYFIAFSSQLIPSVLTKQKAILIPVILYLVIIFVMGLGAYMFDMKQQGTLYFTGAIMFIISDSILSYDFFVKHLNFADAVIYSLYFSAQFLIGISTLFSENC